jgi:hypothetical protein
MVVFQNASVSSEANWPGARLKSVAGLTQIFQNNPTMIHNPTAAIIIVMAVIRRAPYRPPYLLLLATSYFKNQI